MTVDGRSRPRSRWSRPSSTSRHNGDRPAVGLTNRTASDPTQLCPALADAPTTASARISSTTRSSSWYGSPTATTSVIAPAARLLPRLPEATVQAAVEVDHTGNEALVALPPQSAEIIGSSGSSASRTSLTPPTWG